MSKCPCLQRLLGGHVGVSNLIAFHAGRKEKRAKHGTQEGLSPIASLAVFGDVDIQCQVWAGEQALASSVRNPETKTDPWILPTGLDPTYHVLSTDSTYLPTYLISQQRQVQVPRLNNWPVTGFPLFPPTTGLPAIWGRRQSRFVRKARGGQIRNAMQCRSTYLYGRERGERDSVYVPG